MVAVTRAPLAYLCVVALVSFAGAALEAAESLDCDVSVVGAGWAGVYAAYRLVSTGHAKRGLCLFEGSSRVGGRTYSVDIEAGHPMEHFVLDVGAYRFSPDMHLPGDIILHLLKLPVRCYEPDCRPANKDFPPPWKFNYSAPLMRISDAEGNNKGFVTAIEGLLGDLRDLGAHIMMNTKLTDAELVADGVRLTFGSKVVVSKQVFLNLPRPSILALPSLARQTPARTRKAQECIKFDMPDSLSPPGRREPLGGTLAKAYVFYQEAWWKTRLNKTTGEWPTNAFFPIRTSMGIPIGIRFNDGPLHCNKPEKACDGFLEVFYSAAEETFFASIAEEGDALGILSEKDDKTHKFQMLHQAIIEATMPLWNAASLEPPKVAPTKLVVGIWNRRSIGMTAPTKVYYSTSASLPGGPDPLEKACGVPKLTEEEYRESVLVPVTGDTRVLVANNDWVAMQSEYMFGDWAEESLLQAERGLRKLGLERPSWLNASYYEAKVVAFDRGGSGIPPLELIV